MKIKIPSFKRSKATPEKGEVQTNKTMSQGEKNLQFVEDVKKTREAKSNRLNPVMWFSNSFKTARFFMFLSFFLIIALVSEAVLMSFTSTKHQKNIIIMDDFGDFRLVPVMGMKEAVKMHEAIAEFAAMALLQRNPNGLDNKELLVQSFTKPAVKEVEQMLKKDAGRFFKYKIHQKVEIKSIHDIRRSDQKVICNVSGQLIRACFYNGRNLPEGDNFSLNLLLVRNPKFGNSLRMPLAVAKFKLRITPFKDEEKS